jgi:phosphotransferase system enzyme I (PtsI)
MRAAAFAEAMGGQIRIMFPMITTLEEIHRVRKMVRRAKSQLEKEGKDFREVQIGMMLEVPAAAVCIENLLPSVDFVSIGSNDLVQYLMAADRDNPKVSQLCQPLAPPVIQVLYHVVKACQAAKKPLTLCGEMAGQPKAFVLLMGMGLRSFSMSPAFVPSMKDLAAHLSVKQARVILKHALRLKTTVRIRHYMADQLKLIAPNLSLLDTV